MNIFTRLAAVICLSAAALTSGCANKYEQNHIGNGLAQQGKMLVAVLPFQGVSESPGSGLIVADVMANELYALGGYTLITPEIMASRMAPREGETLSPEESGRLVGAPLILTGRVTEYTYKSGVGEQPAVAVTARLIECQTGRVVWSATRARTGSAAWFQEDSLGLLTSRICRDLARSLNGEAAGYGYGSSEEDYTVARYPLQARQSAGGTPPPASSTPAPSSQTSVAAPSSQTPVAAPSSQTPVTTPSSQTPVVPSSQAPVIIPSSQEPVIAPSPQTPVVIPSPQTPAEASSPQVPLSTAVSVNEPGAPAPTPMRQPANQPPGSGSVRRGSDFQYTAPPPMPAPAQDTPPANGATPGAASENGTIRLDGGDAGKDNSDVLLNRGGSSNQVFVFPEGTLWDV